MVVHLPTPTLPSSMTVGKGVALPPERVGTGLRGAGHSQASGANFLQLALVLVTVQFQFHLQGVLGHSGQLPVHLHIHIVDVGIVFR